MMTLLAPPVAPGPALSESKAVVEVRAAWRTSEIDVRVLQRAQAGDPAAVQAFIEHYQGLVFAFLGRSVRERAEVEDLSQEVFLRAYRALPRFEKRTDVKTSTWLLTIATRLLLDERKRRRPSHELSEADLSDPTTPELAGNRHALGRAIQAAAAALPEEQRVSFVLAEFHGLSHDEIAAATFTRTATVKTRLFRARAHLRAALAPFWKDTR